MKIELFSIEELSQKEWKYSESLQTIYIGNSRFPTMTFRASLTHLLGKKYSYSGVKESYRGVIYAYITDHTGEYQVPQFLIKTKLPKIKKYELQLEGGTAKYNGYDFNFPCKYDRLKKSDAVKLARWVLKVSKAKL